MGENDKDVEDKDLEGDSSTSTDSENEDVESDSDEENDKDKNFSAEHGLVQFLNLLQLFEDHWVGLLSELFLRLFCYAVTTIYQVWNCESYS